MTLDRQIALDLLEIKAVGFSLQKPITFKSGMLSPIYVDNRRFPFYPKAWKHVIEGFKELITKNNLTPEVIAGIETAGIPHSAALGFHLQTPSVFVRKAPKDHGTKKRVEGGAVMGKNVLLIEDHVTTGESSLSGLQALRDEGATVPTCLSITSYAFPETRKRFEEAQVTLFTLTTFPVILDVAMEQGYFNQSQKASIQTWFENPWEWKISKE